MPDAGIVRDTLGRPCRPKVSRNRKGIQTGIKKAPATEEDIHCRSNIYYEKTTLNKCKINCTFRRHCLRKGILHDVAVVQTDRMGEQKQQRRQKLYCHLPLGNRNTFVRPQGCADLQNNPYIVLKLLFGLPNLALANTYSQRVVTRTSLQP